MAKYVLLSFDLEEAGSSDYSGVYAKMGFRKWKKIGPSTNMLAQFKDDVSNRDCLDTSKDDLLMSCRAVGVSLGEYVIALCVEKPTFG